MEIKIEDFNEKIRPFEKELLFQESLKSPSIYSLEQAGDRLLTLVKQLREKSKEFDPWLYSLKSSLDIYLADLGGELQLDYDRGNKRYKGKWSNEKNKIVGLISSFRQKILENKTTK